MARRVFSTFIRAHGIIDNFFSCHVSPENYDCQMCAQARTKGANGSAPERMPGDAEEAEASTDAKYAKLLASRSLQSSCPLGTVKLEDAEAGPGPAREASDRLWQSFGVAP